LTDLKDFIRFPTVSAQPKHTDDVKRCASWLAEHLRSVGLERVQILPTPRHPIVYAEWLRAPGKPTVLIYGHYDVQPAEPFAEWRTPPFEPTVVGDDLFGRGAGLFAFRGNDSYRESLSGVARRADGVDGLCLA
jgi:acetylornithine deacetylase/succinyl-diaminopimelate desuccinylase-like protein